MLLGCLCRLSEGRADWLDSCRLSACAEVLQFWFFISTNPSRLVRSSLRKRNQYRQICWYLVVLSLALSLPLNLNPSPRQSFRTQPQNLLSGGKGNSPTNLKSSTPSFWAWLFFPFPSTRAYILDEKKTQHNGAFSICVIKNHTGRGDKSAIWEK